MLRKISIAGFKSIKKQEIFLGRLNVLIGQNGAGKSNILEAVAMLSAALSGEISYSSLRERGVRLSAPSVYRSALRGAHRPKYFDLEAEFDSFRYHCNIYTSNQPNPNEKEWTFHSESFHRRTKGLRWKTVGGRSGHGVSINSSATDGVNIDKAKIKSTDSISSLIKIFGDLDKNELGELEALTAYAIYAPSTSILRGVETDPYLKEPIGLSGGGLPAALRDIIGSPNRAELSRFFQTLSWYRSISVETPDKRLKAKHQGSGDLVLAFRDAFMTNDFNKLYSFDVSEGALYVTFILALMLSDNSPRIFALDNVDSSLNPGLVRSIVNNIADLAQKLDKQVILTTHNPTALDAIDLFNADHYLYVVDRGESGETELTRLKPPDDMTREMWEAQFQGAKLSEMWSDGLLGGITPPGLA